MKTVRDVMVCEPVTISPASRVKTALVLMKGHHIDILPVVGADQSVMGIVTHNKLLQMSEDAPILSVMDADFVTCKSDMSVFEAAERMCESKFNYILIVEDKSLLGIAADVDLLPEI